MNRIWIASILLATIMLSSCGSMPDATTDTDGSAGAPAPTTPEPKKEDKAPKADDTSVPTPKTTG